MIMNIPYECRFEDKIYQDLQGLDEELSGLQTFKILLMPQEPWRVAMLVDCYIRVVTIVGEGIWPKTRRGFPSSACGRVPLLPV